MTQKVVHVITGLGDGGAEGVLMRLCLHSKNFTHVVVSLSDDGKYGKLLRERNITVHTLGMLSSTDVFSGLFMMARILINEKPDIVQTWMYHSDLLGGLMARATRTKRVCWGLRHSVLEKGKSKPLTILIARICALLSRWVPNSIICCAESVAVAHQDIGYDSSCMLVIPNGFDLTSFQPNMQSRTKLRSELGVSSDDFLIGMVGRYDPQKDHMNLLLALAKLKLLGFRFKCCLVGSGLMKTNVYLSKKIEELKLQNDIFLLGQRNDVPSIMNALDLHVLSSSTEGFPNVIAEAMACGTPCVATDVGDASWIIGNTGVTVEPCNPVALADGIIHSYNRIKDIQFSSIPVECVSRIQSEFGLDRMVSDFENAWTR